MKKRCAIGLLMVTGLTPWTSINAQQPSATLGGVAPITPPGLVQPVRPDGSLPASSPGLPGSPTPSVNQTIPQAPPALSATPSTPAPANDLAPVTPGVPSIVPQNPGSGANQTPGLLPKATGSTGLPLGPYSGGVAGPGCANPASCDPPRTPIAIPQNPDGCINFYFGADYLYWFMKRDSFPALLTEGNVQQSTVLGVTPGALGVPGTVTIAPQLNGSTAHSGVRLYGGAWLDQEQIVGIQGSYFFLFQSGPKTTVAGTGGTGTPLIARPHYDATAGVETATTILSPNGQGGSLTISNPSNLMGGDVNIVYNFAASNLTGNRCGLIIGARFMGLDDKLTIDQTSLTTGSSLPAVATNENFTTHNRFYGGQIGLQSENLIGPVYVQTLVKVGIGDTNQVADISGYGNTILVQSSNIGKYTRDVISCVPEAQFNLGYAFNENFMFKAGYNLIVWTNTVRPGNTIDRDITEASMATQTTPPVFNFKSSTFWAQGVQLGLQWTF